MIQIFFGHTPRLLRRYTRGQALQFLFCQSWYTLYSCSLAVLWALPAVALLVNRPIASVGLGQFLLYFLPVVLASTLMWCEARRWFQPGGVRLSWRGIVLQIARWPVVLWALVNVVLRIKRPYMITPTGKAAGAGPRSLTIYGPYVVLAVFPLLASWVFDATAGTSLIRGYYWLALVNAVMAAAVLATTIAIDIRQIAAGHRALPAARWALPVALRARAGTLVALGVVLALLALSVASFGHEAVHAMIHSGGPA
jgi:cellulose synthase (UDP-forming)